MTSDLGLARNLSGLGLAAKSNHIYPSHVTAGITGMMCSFPSLYRTTK